MYICSILNVKFGFTKMFTPITDLAEFTGFFSFFFKTLQRKCFVALALKSVCAEKSQSYVVNVYFLCPERCSQWVLVSMSQWLKLQPGLQKQQQNPVLTAVLLNVLWHVPGFGACLTLFGPVEAGGHKETGRWLGSSFKLASWPFCVLCSSHKVENRQEPTGSEWKLLLFQYIPGLLLKLLML